MQHRYKGKEHQPYHEADTIDTVVVHTIVKSEDSFWLLYAIIPKWKLVKEDVFCRGSERKGGKGTLSLPLGDLGNWLVGKPCHGRGAPDWRSSPLFGWRPPVRIVPSERLPLSYLEGAAQHAARPDLAPSEEKLAALQARLDRALAEQAATEAKQAARQAEAAASRAEAAPSSVTNNINITVNDHSVNNHLHAAGTASAATAPPKRLRDGSIKNFFLGK